MSQINIFVTYRRRFPNRREKNDLKQYLQIKISLGVQMANTLCVLCCRKIFQHHLLLLLLLMLCSTIFWFSQRLLKMIWWIRWHSVISDNWTKLDWLKSHFSDIRRENNWILLHILRTLVSLCVTSFELNELHVQYRSVFYEHLRICLAFMFEI